jgi:uncharacterized protein (TIGR00369 family)
MDLFRSHAFMYPSEEYIGSMTVMNKDLSPTPEEVSRTINTAVPGFASGTFIVEKVDGQTVHCRNIFNINQLRPGGTISGPTLMGLADAAMYAAVFVNIGIVEMAVTQNLNINFLSKPSQRDLLAVAKPLKIGRRSIALEVSIYSEGESQMVAHVTGTYALPFVRES